MGGVPRCQVGGQAFAGCGAPVICASTVHFAGLPLRTCVARGHRSSSVMGMEQDEEKPKGRPQVRRERADRLIAQMVAEADAINADATMVHTVTLLAVFGSYLTDKEVLGDLDVAIQFKARWTPEDFDERKRQFAIDHPMPPSTRRDYFGRMFWPETKLRRRIKVGRGISLHDFSELEILGCPYRVVFGGIESD